MKPMGGGMLQSARLAVGYILQQTPDAILIPGFESIGEFEEMMALDTDPVSLSSDELEAIDSIKRELGRNFCRRCNYCGPSCPQDISIPLGMIMHTLLRRAGTGFFKREMGAHALAKVESCSSCGACEPSCPYDLPIRRILARNAATVREALTREAL
jgi:predicted aldo/keto reductase-like oxidoreductase